MNVTFRRSSPAVTAVLLAILTGMLVRTVIFTNNFYYPNIGMPYTLGLPFVTAVVVGVFVFLIRQ